MWSHVGPTSVFGEVLQGLEQPLRHLTTAVAITSAAQPPVERPDPAAREVRLL